MVVYVYPVKDMALNNNVMDTILIKVQGLLNNLHISLAFIVQYSKIHPC